jgi:prepilin-type N-terminal cleavage/methylation domain-containing protein
MPPAWDPAQATRSDGLGARLVGVTGRLGRNTGPGLCLSGAVRYAPRAAFTLTELIVVIGVLAVAVLPRFVDQRTFNALCYYEQNLAARVSWGLFRSSSDFIYRRESY